MCTYHPRTYAHTYWLCTISDHFSTPPHFCCLFSSVKFKSLFHILCYSKGEMPLRLNFFVFPFLLEIQFLAKEINLSQKSIGNRHERRREKKTCLPANKDLLCNGLNFVLTGSIWIMDVSGFQIMEMYPFFWFVPYLKYKISTTFLNIILIDACFHVKWHYAFV